MGKTIKAFRRRNKSRHYPNPFVALNVERERGGMARAACGHLFPFFKITKEYARLTCRRCKKLARRKGLGPHG